MSTSERIAADHPSRTPRRRREGPWLGIAEASALVGVSEATLRRWAEAGDVEAFVTPGGHRRFLRQAILDLLPRPGRPHRTLRELGGTPERVVRQYRRELTTAGARWLPELDDTAREAFREPGRQILAGILGYLDAPDEASGDGAIESASEAAAAYGRLARHFGLGITTTAVAFFHFRLPFLEELATIARRRRLEMSEAISLVIAAAGAFDRLLPALLDAHVAESATEPPASRPGDPPSVPPVPPDRGS